MFLKKINILNYKNIADADISFSPYINCFIGQNGAGKTNALDAIYYLSFCKSNYSSSDSNNVRHNESFMMLKGEYILEESIEHIHCGIKYQEQKIIKRNGKEYKKLSEHIGLIPLVIIAPADIIMIIGGNEERRRFLNYVISQYDRLYLQKLVHYNRLLSQRNKLLKNLHQEEELIMTLSAQMDPLATYVYEERKKFIDRIQPIFQNYYNTISSNNESVSITYESQLNVETFYNLTKDNFAKDKALKYTSIGIHRDNLNLHIGEEYLIKKEGSQGQKKTYLIALKLAQFDFIKQASGKRPILLLDDIFDKLDGDRVEQIISLVSNGHFGQIFLTDTEKNHIYAVLQKLTKESKIFIAKKGIIKEYEKEQN